MAAATPSGKSSLLQLYIPALILIHFLIGGGWISMFYITPAVVIIALCSMYIMKIYKEVQPEGSRALKWMLITYTAARLCILDVGDGNVFIGLEMFTRRWLGVWGFIPLEYYPILNIASLALVGVFIIQNIVFIERYKHTDLY